MNAIPPLVPALRILEPLGLPASFQEWFAAASAQQSERLARFVAREFAAVISGQPGAVDHVYLRSAAFQANVVQAVRAAEVAESDDKLRFIARALAGCLLAFPAPSVDKFQTMRVIEQLSQRELEVLSSLYLLLDPIDPYADTFSAQTRDPLSGLSQQEWTAALLGLSGLGLLTPQSGGWQLTPLARQVALLTQITE